MDDDTQGVVTNGDDTADETLNVTELDMLKKRARLLGMTFSNNIGIEALRVKVNAKLESDAGIEDPLAASENVNPMSPPEPAQAQVNPLETASGSEPVPEKPLTLRQYMQKEYMKQVRVRITNMDPKKKDLPGEIFTIANEFIGTIRKYVPYGEVTDGGYHLPMCIYTELSERKFQDVKTGRDSKGQVRVTQRWVREFSMEVLPPLTQDELNKLAAAQAAAAGAIEE